MDSTPLQGKNAIVTGGSRGIGHGIALELSRRGAAVVITYRSSVADASKTCERIQNSGGRALAVQADAAHAEKSVKTIVAEAIKFFGPGSKIDIVVNNAGYSEGRGFEAVDTAFFDRMMHTNVLFPMCLFRHCIRHLATGCRIVNVSSVAARGPSPTTPTYAASKAALESITRSMAAAVGRSLDGTANAVNPGPVDTDMWRDANLPDMAAVEKKMASMAVAGERIGEVNDIVPIVAFLCDPSARWITGSVTCANGGVVML